MFSGCITALATPMLESGEIDFDALKKLVRRQLKAGIKGLVIHGTTGESPTLQEKESQAVLETVVQLVNRQIPVIAGTGTYSTHHTIEKTKRAMALGADACLIITPYYNKPSQQGLYAHFKKIADTVPIPIIMYNAPSRTGCDLLPSTIKKLVDVPNIVGLKECAFTLPRTEELVGCFADKLDLFCGNDDEALPAMLLGFKGVISVTANVVPKMMNQMCEYALSHHEGNKKNARRLHQQLVPLNKKLFVESNPVPLKWMLKEMGLIQSGIRLPLVPLSEQYHPEVREVLSQFSECQEGEFV